MKPRWLSKWRRPLCLGISRLRWWMLRCAQAWSASVSWSSPLSLCCFTVLVSHCGLALWLLLHLLWFMVVVVSKCISYLSLCNEAPQNLVTQINCNVLILPALLLDSSADLAWVYLHGFSQLVTHLQWLRQLGYCGLSFHVVSSWLSSWHGYLRVPEGRKLQDLSWQRLESLIATLLHSITRSKSEDQSSFKRWQSRIVTGI